MRYLAAMWLLLIWCGTAAASIHGGGGGSGGGGGTTCPKGNAVVDGCNANNAPAIAGIIVPSSANQGGTYIDSTFWTDAPTSGQVLAFKPAYNVPGADYPISYWTPLGSLCDPNQHGVASCPNFPTGCTWAVATSTANGQLTCTNAVAAVIAGWDFGAINGHASGWVQIKGTGSYDIHNNHFQADQYTAGLGLYFYGLVQIGGAGTPSTASGVIYDNEFDGQWMNSGVRQYSLNAIGINNNTSTTVSCVIMYNYMHGFTGHQIQGIATNCAPYFVGYNVIQAWNNTAFNGHGEAIQSQGAYMGAVSYVHNVFWQTLLALAGQTSSIQPSGTPGGATTSLLFDGNVFVGGNFIGGISTNGQTFYSTIDDGTTGHANGSVLTYCTGGVNAGLGQPYQGFVSGSVSPVSGGPAGANGVNILWQLNSSPPAGLCASTGSQWLVSCQGGNAGVNLSQCGPSGTFFNTSGNYVGQAGQVQPAVYNVTTPTSYGWGSVWANYIAISADHATFNGTPGMTITNNYLNTMAGQGYFYAAGGASCPGGAAIFSGNVDMVSGASVNAWSSNSSVGC